MPAARSKKEGMVWAALVLLCVGLGLVDRSFAWWRDDGRNFPSPDGIYRPLEPGTEIPGFWSNHTLLKTMAISGSAMLLVSIGLFGITGARPRQEG